MKNIVIMMLAALAAGAADDPGGWSKAKWGMTETQLADAFGSEAIHPEPCLARHGCHQSMAEAFTADAIHIDRNYRKNVHIAVDLDLTEIPCRAEMIPDPAGHLKAVLILPRNLLSDSADSLYAVLHKMLVEKYGDAWKSSDDPGVTTLQWSFPTTLITLTRVKFPIGSTHVVSLEYQRITLDSDKL